MDTVFILCNIWVITTTFITQLNIAAMTTPTPRQLLLKLLGSRADEELDVTAAIRAGALFNISENNTRVALTRLQAAGFLETVARGAYRLGVNGQALANEVGVWRTVEQTLCHWEGGWVAVLTSPLKRSDKKAIRTRERAFAMLGIQELENGLFVRPDNFIDAVPSIRERLHRFGLESQAPVFLAMHFDQTRDRKARLLWDTGNIEQTYQNNIHALERSLSRLNQLSLADSARETYILGDQAIRCLVFDPLLPSPLVNESKRRALRELMQTYDKIGHEIWKQFLDSNEN